MLKRCWGAEASAKRKLFVLAAVACLLGSGCVARARAGAVVTGPAIEFYEPPPLVAVDAGVWVVEDYPVTVYYHDDAYWYYEGGVWYRRARWDGVWVTADVNVVPTIIVQRDHRRYVHYHRPGRTHVWREPPRGHVRGGAGVRARTRIDTRPLPRPGGEVRARGRVEVRTPGVRVEKRPRPRVDVPRRPPREVYRQRRGDERVRVRGEDRDIRQRGPRVRPRRAPPHHPHR
jgi:hypothetical protein